MLGVLLAEAGHDVTLLASDRTSTAINVNGLTLHSSRYGELQVRLPARPWLTAPVDVLFVTVKAPDLLAALTRAPAPLLRERRSCHCSTVSTTSRCYGRCCHRPPWSR